METLNVMVVDDEPGICLAITRIIQDFRMRHREVDAEIAFQVRTAGSGEEALGAMRHQPPDLLILDHKLPGISGLDVLDQIRSHDYEILTIVITAYASIETAISATKRGAYDFIAKPFTPDELKATVRKAASRIMLARQAHRLQQERRQVRFQFISVLAHELKTPLNAIDGYLQLIQDGTLDERPEKRRDVVGRCVRRIEAMRKMIQDLLDLTRIESGQKKRTFETLDLCEVGRDALQDLSPLARERGITLHLHADRSIQMQADRGELDIIFNNLLSNAIKYNREGGRVDVELKQADALILIQVSDTGIGMEPDETSKLFEDFVRIKNQKTRDIPGSGLGLSTVKKIATLYHGEVQVESRPEVGSTFTVSLNPNRSPEPGG